MNNQTQLVDLEIALEKIQQLKQQLEEKDKEIKYHKEWALDFQEQLKEAVETISFYANADSWMSDADSSPHYYDCIVDDSEKCNEDGYRFECGGKRARQFLAKYRGEK